MRSITQMTSFSEITGPVRNTSQGQEALSYFKLFFTEKIIEDRVSRNEVQLQ